MTNLKGKYFTMSGRKDDGTYYPICVARNVVITIDGDVLEATKDTQSNSRSYYYGFNNYSISVTGLVSIDTTQFTESELEDYKLQRKVLYFKCEDSQNPALIYSGDLIIKKISKDTDYTNMQTFSMDCQGSGDLNKTGVVPNINYVKDILVSQTSGSTATINFTNVGTATSWTYRLNGGAPVSVTSTTINLTGINQIVNSILIVPDGGDGSTMVWVMTGICYSSVSGVTVQQIDATSALVSWAGNTSLYSYNINGITGSTSAQSVLITGLPSLTSGLNATITPICSNGVNGTPGGATFNMVAICNSAVSNITYTQDTSGVYINFISSGGATSWEYSVNGGAGIVINTPSLTLTGLTPLASYTVVIKPKCGTSNYGSSNSITFTATGSLLQSPAYSTQLRSTACTGANKLGQLGTYSLSLGAYNLVNGTSTTIGADITSYPGFPAGDRTGLTFGLTPDNTGTKYAIDDSQTSINSKTAALAWAVAQDVSTNGQTYVNANTPCYTVPGAIGLDAPQIGIYDSAIQQVPITIPATYFDSIIDNAFNGLLTGSVPTVGIRVNYKKNGLNASPKTASLSYDSSLKAFYDSVTLTGVVSTDTISNITVSFSPLGDISTSLTWTSFSNISITTITEGV